MRAGSRRRRSSWIVAASLVTAALTACSGSSLPEMASAPKISASGKHYSFSAAHVARTKWPNPCSLLTSSAGSAALGTSISVRRFHTSCYYTPDSNTYPTLTITLLAIGTGSGSSYERTSAGNKSAGRSSIHNVGRAAYLHPVRHLPAFRLDVLTHYAHFSITEQSPIGQRLGATRAETLLIAVGRVVAKAFKA